MSRIVLNDNDRKIIECLREDARMSYTEIAERVGVSRVAVTKRISVLEQRDIIRGYMPRLRTELDDEVYAIVELKVEPDMEQDVLNHLAADSRFIEVFNCRDVNASVRGIAVFSSEDDYLRFKKDGMLPGVISGQARRIDRFYK